MKRTLYLALVAAFSALASAQDMSPRKGPSVTMSPVPIISIPRGKSGTVELEFHISSGFHVNSNQPHSELLIPTSLKLTAPTDIVIGKVTYSEGRDMMFPFSPDEKVNVYSVLFTTKVLVRPLGSVLPARYAVHGQLRYQACDNATCFPPKNLPVDFQVKIVRSETESSGRNPAQSPHSHR